MNMRDVLMTCFISEDEGTSFRCNAVGSVDQHPIKRFTEMTTEKKSRAAGIHDHMLRRLSHGETWRLELNSLPWNRSQLIGGLSACLYACLEVQQDPFRTAIKPMCKGA